MEQNLPEYLCRVTKPNYEVNEKGIIQQHGFSTKLWTLDGPILTTHLVHPEEWQFIARFYAFPGNNGFMYDNGFRLLEIKTSDVKKLSHDPHPLLRNGEFFGEININDLIGDELYQWKRTNLITTFTKRQIKHYPKLENTKGWRPYTVNRVDNLPTIDKMLGIPK